VAATCITWAIVEGQEVLRAGQGKLAMVPEGRGVFTRMTSGKPADGRLHRNDKGQIQADIDRCSRSSRA
jgi:branched-chain amino acid transport system ATP-binding protein